MFSHNVHRSLAIALVATFTIGCAQSYSTGVDGEQRPRIRPLLPWRRGQERTFGDPTASALPETMPFVASQPRRGSLPREEDRGDAEPPNAEESPTTEPSVYVPSAGSD